MASDDFQKFEMFSREIKLMEDLHKCLKTRPYFKQEILEYLFRDIERIVIIEKHNGTI
jgi:hypothetical protein